MIEVLLQLNRKKGKLSIKRFRNSRIAAGVDGIKPSTRTFLEHT